MTTHFDEACVAEAEAFSVALATGAPPKDCERLIRDCGAACMALRGHRPSDASSLTRHMGDLMAAIEIVIDTLGASPALGLSFAQFAHPCPAEQGEFQ